MHLLGHQDFKLTKPPRGYLFLSDLRWKPQSQLAYQIANLFSILLTKVFAYCTNKKFVFRTKTGFREQVSEIIRYVLGRGITGVVDFLGLIVLVNWMAVDDRIGKMVMIVITTALNYLLGKLFVFRQKQMPEEPDRG